MFPYEVLDETTPYENDPVTYLETIDNQGRTITLLDKSGSDTTFMYVSLTPSFADSQAFYACPCAPGYS